VSEDKYPDCDDHDPYNMAVQSTKK